MIDVYKDNIKEVMQQELKREDLPTLGICVIADVTGTVLSIGNARSVSCVVSAIRGLQLPINNCKDNGVTAYLNYHPNANAVGVLARAYIYNIVHIDLDAVGSSAIENRPSCNVLPRYELIPPTFLSTLNEVFSAHPNKDSEYYSHDILVNRLISDFNTFRYDTSLTHSLRGCLINVCFLIIEDSHPTYMKSCKESFSGLGFFHTPTEILKLLGVVLTVDAEIYGDNNWREAEYSKYIPDVLRYIEEYRGGNLVSQKHGIPVLGQLLAKLMFILELIQNDKA